MEKLINRKSKSSLLQLIDKIAYDPGEEKKKLEKPFDENGTQGILVATVNLLVLAFRGTEATSIKDIKADARAKIKGCTRGGKVHSGFSDAYDEVALDIQTTLNQDEYKDKPLFITGRSLGGAVHP